MLNVHLKNLRQSREGDLGVVKSLRSWGTEHGSCLNKEGNKLDSHQLDEVTIRR